MQISRETLKKILLHVLIIFVLLRLFFIPIYKEHNEKKEIFLKKVRDYKSAMILKQDSNFVISNNLIKKVFYSTEETTFIQTLLLSYVEDLCKKNNITISNFELNEPSLSGKISEISILLKLEGKPSQIIKFLNDLKTYSKILDIKNFELLETDRGYSFTVVLSTYRVEK